MSDFNTDTFSSDNERYNEIARENGIEVGNNTDHIETNESVKTEEPTAEKVNQTQTQETENLDPFQSNEAPKGEVDDKDVESSTQSKATDDNLDNLPKGFQNQLKRNKRTIERLKKELEEARAEATKSLQSSQSSQEVVNEDPYKDINITRENFTSDEQYLDYLATQKAQDYLTKQNTARAEQEKTQKTINNLTNEWTDKISKNFTSKEEVADYQEAISSLGNPSKVMRPDVVEYIFKHDAGPKLLKYFADRPEAVKKVNNMHPYDMVDALKQITSYVSQPKKQVQKPVQPIGGLTNKNPGHNTRSAEDMTDEELLTAYRNGKL
jgi:hypothetical protein